MERHARRTSWEALRVVQELKRSAINALILRVNIDINIDITRYKDREGRHAAACRSCARSCGQLPMCYVCVCVYVCMYVCVCVYVCMRVVLV